MERNLRNELLLLYAIMSSAMDTAKGQLNKAKLWSRAFRVALIALSLSATLITGFNFNPSGVNLAFIITAFITAMTAVGSVFMFDQNYSILSENVMKLTGLYTDLGLYMIGGKYDEAGVDRLKDRYSEIQGQLHQKNSSAIDESIKQDIEK